MFPIKFVLDFFKNKKVSYQKKKKRHLDFPGATIFNDCDASATSSSGRFF